MALKFNPQIELTHERDDATEYIMHVEDEFVEISVTHSPRKVAEWITATENRNLIRLHRLIVALDVQSLPATAPEPENPAAVLVLLVHTRCLIYQIQKSDGTIPEDLKNFLNYSDYRFVAVGMENYKEKLNRDYSLEVKKAVDLSHMAAYELAEPDLRNAILQQLSMRFLRKFIDLEEVMNVKSSDWSSNKLSDEQVMFASLTAFVSFGIARILESWYD